MSPRLIAPFLLLVLAFLQGGPAFAVETYMAFASGEITVDPLGRVQDARVSAPALGPEIEALVADQMRRWQFEPAADASAGDESAGVALVLVAHRERKAGTTSIGIASAYFRHRPGTVPGGSIRSVPPVYPEQAYRKGVGAHVEVWVELDGEGQVVQAAATRALLFNTRDRHFADAFMDSAERAAARWIYPDARAGEIHYVPVSFNAGPAPGSGKWLRVLPEGRPAPPPWDAARTAPPRFRLKTALAPMEIPRAEK